MLVKSKVRILGNQIWVEFEDGLYQCDRDDRLKEIEDRVTSLLPNVGGNEWNPMSDDINPGEVVGEIEVRCIGFNDIEEILTLTILPLKGIDWNSEAVEGTPVISKGGNWENREIYHRCIISLDKDGCLCHDKDNTVRQLNAVGWRVKK